MLWTFMSYLGVRYWLKREFEMLGGADAMENKSRGRCKDWCTCAASPYHTRWLFGTMSNTETTLRGPSSPWISHDRGQYAIGRWRREAKETGHYDHVHAADNSTALCSVCWLKNGMAKHWTINWTPVYIQSREKARFGWYFWMATWSSFWRSQTVPSTWAS